MQSPRLDRFRQMPYACMATKQKTKKTRRNPMNKPAGFDLVERARAVAPLIAAEADEIERSRRLTPAVVSALIENGLYRGLLPKNFGGGEVAPEIFMQMLE